jgi:hypothetical protein
MSAVTRSKAIDRLAAKGLLILLGIQHDGGVYGLDFRSRERIKEAFPDVEPLPMVMLGHRRDTEFDRLHPRRWEVMVPLLTGLTKDQIARLGGVRIYDTDNERLVWEWLTTPIKE